MGVIGAIDGQPHEVEQRTCISLCLGSLPGVEARVVHVTLPSIPDAGERSGISHCRISRCVRGIGDLAFVLVIAKGCHHLPVLPVSPLCWSDAATSWLGCQMHPQRNGSG